MLDSLKKDIEIMKWSCPYKSGHPSSLMPVFYTPSVTSSSTPCGDGIHYNPQTRTEAIP
jgi:hypothetical protein